ncbi:CGNR zinc finger domain-containing protein [Microbacterium oxydans]|uniref:CGNR zinc finger n=1 Tax=Microbacterium oxydans TaxID=82380 RepID=A0A0F0L7M3_9MICO|nr:CGNR zinc finger domain-containing protein [Microbacterium oxydans]KJL28674.1 CGNR zinc finger [Microbacterium oxydans]
MHLNPYGEYAVLLAVSLANDWPVDRAGIEERTLDMGMTMTFPPASDDHAQIRAVIDDWLRIVDEPDHDARALLLNEQLATAAAYPRLTNHDGEGWHLHYRDDVESLPFVLRAIISLGTSLHLVTRGMSRLGRCEAAPCTNVVADVTRNGRQRFCSVRCANRAAVRRHRARASA